MAYYVARTFETHQQASQRLVKDGFTQVEPLADDKWEQSGRRFPYAAWIRQTNDGAWIITSA